MTKSKSLKNRKPFLMLYPHLGELALLYQGLEDSLDVLLCALITDEQGVARILIEQRNFEFKLNKLFMKIYKLRHQKPKQVAEAQSLINRIEVIRRKRNLYIHSQVSPSSKDKHYITLKVTHDGTPTGTQLDKTVYSIEDVKKLITEIRKVEKDLFAHFKKFKIHVPGLIYL